jgi:hypothetical protein
MARGRKHTPTEETRRIVKNLAIAGFPHDKICLAVDIGTRTLETHYKHELQAGSLLATAEIAGTLYEKAKAGDTTACIFWMKTRAGWRENVSLDHTSSDGSMSPREVRIVAADVATK